MQSFPTIGRRYIWFVIAAGFAVFGCRLYSDLGYYVENRCYDRLYGLIAVCTATVIASFMKFTIAGKARGGDKKNITFTLAILPVFFALLQMNTLAAMLCGIINMSISLNHGARTPWYQVLFSIATLVLSALAGSMALHWGGFYNYQVVHLSLSNPALWTAVGHIYGSGVLAGLLYFLVNSILLALVVGLTSGRNPFAVWCTDIEWTAINFLASASIAVIAYLLLREPNFSAMMLAFVLAVLPVSAMVLLTSRLKAESLREQMRHIGRLTEKNRELEKSQDEIQKILEGTVESFVLAINAKDAYTHDHVISVQQMAVQIARAMKLSDRDVKEVEMGALLHDVGKLGISDRILTKTSGLSDAEFVTIKSHPVIGDTILHPVKYPWPVVDAVRFHHERWDGSGYPCGLRGNAIPLSGRILAVADVFAALTSDRCYRESWRFSTAVDYISKQGGLLFDPHVVAAFNEIVKDDPRASDEEMEPDQLGEDISPVELLASLEPVQTSFDEKWLNQIAMHAPFDRDFESLIAFIGANIVAQFQPTAFLLLMRDSLPADLSSDSLKMIHGYGIDPDEQIPLALSENGLTMYALKNGAAFLGQHLVDDLPIRSTALRSSLIVPLRAQNGNDILGTINLYHEQENRFDTTTMKSVLEISDCAARALKNLMAQGEVREPALSDPLTGLPNVRQLAMSLDEAVYHTQTARQELTLVALDLDDFKAVNRKFGRDRGNTILQELGGILRSNLRNSDLVARSGSDEFVLVLRDAGTVEAKRICETIRAAVHAYDLTLDPGNAEAGWVGLSIGIAVFPHDGRDADSLVEYASVALEADKTYRKGAYFHSTPHLLPKTEILTEVR